MDSIKNYLNKLYSKKVVFYFLLAVFCMFLASKCNEYDFDLYARLIVGEHLIEAKEFLYQDFLSYTPTHIWYDHEWGASVVFYLLFKYLGPLGFVLFQALALFGTSVFIIKTQRLQKHPYPASLAFMGLVLLLFWHLNPSLVRCHAFSFFFFSVFLYILEKTDKGKAKNLIWAIPPIIVLWNNIHGGVVSGLGLIFMYLVGAILTRKPWLKYLLVLLVSVPLLAINPYGHEYINFLISANTKQRKYITEWWSVFVQRHAYYYYPPFCVAVFGLIISFMSLLKARKFDITKFIVVLVTSALGIIHVKLLPLAVIAISSLYYNDIMNLFNKKIIRAAEKIAYILIVISLIIIPYTSPGTPRVNARKFPVLETEFLRINNLDGNILTTFGFGSYVSYKRYPNNLIYIDGRYEEVYYDEEFDNLVKYETGEDGWEDAINLYPTEILMPEKIAPCYTKLKESKEWDLIYEGPVNGIFVRKENNKKNYKQPLDNLKYYQDSAFDNNGKFKEKL